MVIRWRCSCYHLLHTLQCEYEHIRRKAAVANISGLARSAQYSGQQLTWNIARLLLLGSLVKFPAEAILLFSPLSKFPVILHV